MGISLAKTYKMGLLMTAVGAGLLAITLRRATLEPLDALTAFAVAGSVFIVVLGLRIVVDRTPADE